MTLHFSKRSDCVVADKDGLAFTCVQVARRTQQRRGAFTIKHNSVMRYCLSAVSVSRPWGLKLIAFSVREELFWARIPAQHAKCLPLCLAHSHGLCHCLQLCVAHACAECAASYTCGSYAKHT